MPRNCLRSANVSIDEVAGLVGAMSQGAGCFWFACEGITGVRARSIHLYAL